MSAVIEIPLYLSEADMPGLTAGADDDDFSVDKAIEIAKNVFGIGMLRVRELSKLIKPDADGSFRLPHCHDQYGSGFTEKSNYAYVTKTFPWLHTKGNWAALDPDDAEEQAGDLERYVARIPQEDWDEFINMLEELDSYPVLDEDGQRELEQAEEQRWVKEDGVTDLRVKLLQQAQDSLTAFIVSRAVTPSVFWDVCGAWEEYPQIEDDSAWMDVDKHVDEQDLDTLAFVVDNVPARFRARLEKVWPMIKRRVWDEYDLGYHVDAAIKECMPADDYHAHDAHNRMDDDRLWNFFQRLVPDSAYSTDSLSLKWMMLNPREDKIAKQKWACVTHQPSYGEQSQWTHDFIQAIKHEFTGPKLNRAMALLKGNSIYPFVHPELPLGEAAPVPPEPDPSLDDAEAWLRTGGHLRSTPVYIDELIEITEPRDVETWSRLTGDNAPSSGWGFSASDQHFVVIARGSGDLFGHGKNKCLGAFVEEDGTLVSTSRTGMSLEDLLADPTYGKAVRRGFLKTFRSWYRNNEQRSTQKDLLLLMQIGGAKEVTRITKNSPEDMRELEMAIGMAAVKSGRLKEAAKYLGHPLASMDKKGVWLFYKDYSSFESLFKNPRGAEEVFAGEHHGWFDYLWEQGGSPSVEDSIEWMSKDAVAHIRKILINREVWFPEAGEDGQGAFLPLTKQIMAEHKDADILNWIERPSDEDEESGVFDDIREAIQDGARDMLAVAGNDQVSVWFQDAALDAISAREPKFITATDGKSDRLTVYVNWSDIIEAYDEMVIQQDITYSNSLEDTLLERWNGTISTEHQDFGANWPKKTDGQADYYREVASEKVMELEETPEYVDPDQTTLPLGEAVDDPRDDLTDWLIEPPHSVVVEMTEIVGALTHGLAWNVAMQLKKSRYGHFLFSVEFAIAPRFSNEEQSKLGLALEKHVINALAHVGYAVMGRFNRCWKTELEQHSQVGYEWAVKKGNFQ